MTRWVLVLAAAVCVVLTLPFAASGTRRSVAKRADLVVPAVSGPKAPVAPGSKMRVRDRTVNRGKRRTPGTQTRYYLSRDRKRGRGDRWLGSRRVRRVRPRQSNRGSKRVTVPRSAPPGAYYLLACADATRRVRERREGNNCQAGGARVTVGAPAGGAFDLRHECQRYAPQGIDVRECASQVEIAKAATAKYRDSEVARADGFVTDGHCEHSTAGTMGQHWNRVDRIAQQGVDPRTPEQLLYLPTAAGLKLVAVEYSENALVDGLPYYRSEPPDSSHTTPAPLMFGGRRFDGPMHGHIPVQPWHHDLHVWLWERNPAGLFAQYNPSLSC